MMLLYSFLQDQMRLLKASQLVWSHHQCLLLETSLQLTLPEDHSTLLIPSARLCWKEWKSVMRIMMLIQCPSANTTSKDSKDLLAANNDQTLGDTINTLQYINHSSMKVYLFASELNVAWSSINLFKLSLINTTICLHNSFRQSFYYHENFSSE